MSADLAAQGWTLAHDGELEAAAWTAEHGASPLTGGRVRIWERGLQQGKLIIQVFKMPGDDHYHAIWGIQPWMSQPVIAKHADGSCFSSESDIAAAVLQMALDLFAQIGTELSKLKQEINPYAPIFSMRPTGGTIQ